MNKSKDLVTVILSVYNSEKTITASIDSLVNQTYKNLEILIIDDGSEDSSLDICKKYENEYLNIRVYENEENIGLTKSLNKLIKKANNLDVTIGMQMVLMPNDADQIIPLAKLGKELRPDYLIIKHCSDNEDGGLGINYDAYEELYPILEEAESYSDESYKVIII